MPLVPQEPREQAQAQAVMAGQRPLEEALLLVVLVARLVLRLAATSRRRVAHKHLSRPTAAQVMAAFPPAQAPQGLVA